MLGEDESDIFEDIEDEDDEEDDGIGGAEIVAIDLPVTVTVIVIRIEPLDDVVTEAPTVLVNRDVPVLNNVDDTDGDDETNGDAEGLVETEAPFEIVKECVGEGLTDAEKDS